MGPIERSRLNYPGRTGEISAYLARPAGPEPHPALVLVHEIFGLTPHIEQVADRLASEGYAVLAPHLFSSRHVPPEMTSANIALTMRFFRTIPPERQRDSAFVQSEIAGRPAAEAEVLSKLLGVMFALPRPLLAEELEAGVDFLEAQPYVLRGRIGSLGFCFGGAMSLELATHGRTRATVAFYGQNPEPVGRLARRAGPVLGIYGGTDARINAELGTLVSELVRQTPGFEIVVYEGAPHAFFNDTSENYRPAAAMDAWGRVQRFLRAHLAPAPPPDGGTHHPT